MATRRKLGAFAGVFTPSILTILGVIMYLRLPQVVGQGGLWATLGILAVAHVVSVTTGLSVSSIATDKRVKAGGSYYIISRSLGLPIGGTVGLALFVGLAASVSLYVIGFAESLLTYFQVGLDPETGRPTVDAIRLAGSAALLVVAAITMIGSSLATKLQYIVMAAIVVSLVAIGLGDPAEAAPATSHLDPLTGSPSLAVLFGLLFPAVTGFEAGVSRSGDLQDPKRDIPRGTLAAIGVGFLIYVGAAVFLAYRVPADQLAGNDRVLFDFAVSAPLVAAGVWGATISGAFGSILGAPRILQAAALDRIAPRFLAAGSGSGNEPRSALLVTCAVAEGGVLLGSFDTVAALVTVVFMASYAVLNLASAVESWASPDFRPDFRIPRFVSLLGAALSLALLVLFNVPAMFAAIATMALVFLWLKRKELAVQGGDTWSGVWASIARKALDRLSRREVHPRNWRPNILAFSRDRGARQARDLLQGLVAHNGVMTELTLTDSTSAPPPRGAEAAPPEEGVRPEGIFRRQLAVTDPWDTIAQVARFHGIGGYAPNTTVVEWDLIKGAPDRTAALLAELDALGQNVVLHLHTHAAAPGPLPQIDVWWRGSARNLALGAAVVRFLTISGEWVQARPRFFATVADPGQRRTIERRVTAWVAETRLDAEVRVLDAPLAPDTFEALVNRVSGRADLLVVSLDAASGSEDGLAAVFAALEGVRHPVLLVRAAASFEDPFPHIDLAATASADEQTATLEVRRDRPVSLQLTGDRALSHHIVVYRDALIDALDGWVKDGPAALVHPFSRALDDIARLTERALVQISRAAAIAQLSRRRRVVYRVERGLLRGLEDELWSVAKLLGDAQKDTLRAALGVLSDRLRAVEESVSEILLVAPDGAGEARAAAVDVERHGDPATPGELAAARVSAAGYVRWPMRRHVVAVHATEGRIAVRDSLLRLRERREQLFGAIDSLVGWAVTVVGFDAALVSAERGDGDEAPAELTKGTAAALAEQVKGCRELLDQTLVAQRRAVAVFARDAAQHVATALATPLETRRVKGGHGAEGSLDVGALLDELSPAFALQHHHLVRTELDVALRGMHRDLEAMAEEVRSDLRHRIAQRVLVGLDVFVDELRALGERLRTEPGAAHTLSAREDVAFDDQAVLQRMIDAIERDTEALPESVETLSEASFQALSEGRVEDLEEVTIAVRRLVAFVLKTDLLGALRESLASLAAATTRAANAVRDVARLVSFAGGGASEADLEEAGDERLEILEAGVERVAAEQAHVERAWHATEGLLGELLTQVVERTRIAAIGQSAGKLDRFIRTHERRGLGAWLRRAGGRARDAGRRGMVDLSYRWSRGVLLARRLRATPDEPASAVERIIALHRASTPSPAVWEALPIFYRQVFLGRAAADPAYWLPASEELTAAERAVDTHRLGHPGALWITGPSGSGVGAVTRRITQERFGPERTFVVRPVEHGSIDPAQFEAAVCQAVGRSGDVDEALGTLPEGSAVVVEELELWWERSPGGLAVVERLGEVVERHGGRILFVVGVNVHVMRLLRRLGVLVDQVLATVHCHPLEAMRLKDAVMRRHDATGLGLRLEGESRERGPSDWKTARLFTGLFDASDGYIGVALHTWIAHIVEVTSDYVVVRRPRTLAVDALDALDPEWASLLVELVLHRRMDRSRLSRVTGLAPERLDAALAGLRRAGLVVGGRDGEAVAIERFVQRHVERWLLAREVL